jgi:hypothetical protein
MIPKFLIFNFYTRAYLNSTSNFQLIRRLKTILSDLFFAMTVLMPIFILSIFSAITLIIKYHFAPEISMLLSGIIPFSMMLFLFLNKDFYDARSISKRIYGYQIIDCRTNQIANELHCLLRNLTLIIWPIEVLIVLFSPTRRLGDMIAGTKLVDKKRIDPESILIDMNQNIEGKKIGSLILLSIVFIIVFDLFAIGLTMID